MKLIIDELTDNIRIDTYLADYMQDFSRSKIQSEIKKGSVLVNSKNVKPSYSVKEGDEIVFEIPETTIKIEPENIPIDIIWEDEFKKYDEVIKKYNEIKVDRWMSSSN